MTTKCASPSCSRPFLYFRSGKIYLIDALASNDGGSPESARKGVEYFWLCGVCSQNMHVTPDRRGSVVVEPTVVEQTVAASTMEAPLRPRSAIRTVVRAIA